jgi:hypothetical protein
MVKMILRRQTSKSPSTPYQFYTSTLPLKRQTTFYLTTVTKLKKVYNITSNALALALEENGTPDQWGNLGGSSNAAGAEIITNTLKKYLKVTKNCGAADKYCGSDRQIFTMNGALEAFSGYSSLMLADGSVLSVSVRDANCNNNRGSGALANTCAVLRIDVNGINPPNTLGKDDFIFDLTKTAIIPHGKWYIISVF